jgi:hypothetical protein
MQIKKEYDALKDAGDLELLFPGASGDWEKDKKQFTTIYQANQEMLKNYDVNFSEES